MLFYISKDGEVSQQDMLKMPPLLLPLCKLDVSLYGALNLSTLSRNKGKNGKVIVVAIMRKLLHLIFGVLKNNSPFQPNFSLD